MDSSDDEVWNADEIVEEDTWAELLEGVDVSESVPSRPVTKRQRIQNRSVQPRREHAAEPAAVAAQSVDIAVEPDHEFPAESESYFPPEESLEEESQHNEAAALEARMQEVMTELRNFGVEVPTTRRLTLTEHQEKSKANHEAWERVRSSLHLHHVQGQAVPDEGALCFVCNQRPVVVKCLDCIQGGWLLCGPCDAGQHPYAHFHRRRMFSNGFCEPIPPDVEFDAEGVQKSRGMQRLHVQLVCFAFLFNICISNYWCTPLKFEVSMYCYLQASASTLGPRSAVMLPVGRCTLLRSLRLLCCTPPLSYM